MKKTMFKKVFAGITAMFMMCLFLPIGFTGTNFKPSLETVAERSRLDKDGGWQTMNGIEYKIEGDTLIINNCKQSGTTSFDGYFFQSYAADIKHLEIGSGWEIGQVWLNLDSIESLTIGDNCTITKLSFYNCNTLKSVTIGENCIIHENAFYGCSNISNADCKKSTIVIKSGNPEIIQNCCHECNHTLDNSLTCTICGYKCVRHSWWSTGCCGICGYVCKHPSYSDGKCTDCRYACIHPSYSDGKCTVCGYECKHIKSCDINHKCKVCGYECKQHTLNENYTCTICGYFDEAAIKAEIEANEAEIKQKENEIKQKEERNAYLNSLLNQQENNTASTFSNGSVLVIIGGSIFLILCGLAAVTIVKKRKKTE